MDSYSVYPDYSDEDLWLDVKDMCDSDEEESDVEDSESEEEESVDLIT